MSDHDTSRRTAQGYRSSHARSKALLAAAVSALLVCESAHAAAYTWKTPGTTNNQTFTWSTLANWTTDTSPNPSDYTTWLAASSYPNLSADTAVIDNQFNNAAANKWQGGGPGAALPTAIQTNIQLDVTGVNMSSLTIRDQEQSLGTDYSLINFRVSQDATIQTINTNYDGGSRSFWTIDASRTLSVNTISSTANYINGINGGAGSTLKFINNGGTATWNYLFQGSNQDMYSMIWDITDPTTMVMTRAAGAQSMEYRATTIKVGNASANQAWNIGNGGVPLKMIMRAVGGEQTNFIKTSTFDVDMGKRTSGTPSDGVSIERSTTGDHGSSGQRFVFTSAAGGQVGTSGANSGAATIANYLWQQSSDTNAASNILMWDKIGSNVILNGNSATTGSLRFAGTNSANENDVNMLWVLPTNTVQVQGASGNITINDQYAVGTSLPGRMGIYFAGATLDARGSLLITGPSAAANSANAFLNDGTSQGDANTGGTIKIGGNVTVQARNAAGFTTLTNLSAGTSAASDDFDLRSTLLQMDGGGSGHTLTWQNGATARNGVGLVAGDFSQANFMLGTFKVTNSTAASYVDGSVLYLNADFILDVGSTLTLNTTGEINLLDLDNSETARLNSYITGGQLLNAHIVQTDGVGESILPGTVPEPASLGLLGLGALGILGRRQRKPA
jgi:hypothetical protein